MGPESFKSNPTEVAKAEQEKDYGSLRHDALVDLQRSGGGFRVERSEEIKPGIYKKEYDWQIEAIKDNGNIVVKKEDNDAKDVLRKEIPGKEFAMWQSNYLGELGKVIDRIGKERGIRTDGKYMSSPDYKNLVQEVYSKNHITKELCAIRDLMFREIMGA